MGLQQSDANWSQCSGILDCSNQRELMRKLVFIETRSLENPYLHLEDVEIFRTLEAPYDCLMRTSKTFCQQSVFCSQYLESLSRLSKLIHKNVAALHFVSVEREANLCMRTVSVNHYASYYGLELRDSIENRKKEDWRFEEEEVLYVARSLVSLGCYLKSQGFVFGAFSSKNLYMSSEGFLKAYLFHLQSDNRHSQYFKLLATVEGGGMTGASAELPIPPEFAPHLIEAHTDPKLDFEKCDVFCLGMLLVEMMVPNSLQRYYDVRRESIRFEAEKLSQDLQQLSSCYSSQLIEFLRKVTHLKPQNRPTMSEAEAAVVELKKELSFACRLQTHQHSSEDMALNGKMSYEDGFRKPSTEHILRSIQNGLELKLNAAPLRLVSKPPTFRSFDEETQKTVNPRRAVGVSLISRQNWCAKKSGTLGERDSSVKVKMESEVEKKHCKKWNSKFSERDDQSWMTLGSTRVQDEKSELCGSVQQSKSIHKIRGKNKAELNKDSLQTVSALSRQCQNDEIRMNQCSRSLYSTRVMKYEGKTSTVKALRAQRPTQNDPLLLMKAMKNSSFRTESSFLR